MPKTTVPELFQMMVTEQKKKEEIMTSKWDSKMVTKYSKKKKNVVHLKLT